MSVFESPRYEVRKVSEWLKMAGQGEIRLPVFQRSYVWKKPQMVADYLLAVFQNRPTGLFLILGSAPEPQFESRPLTGLDYDQLSPPRELLLDGQQRLTSLWQAFSGTSPVRYYIQVNNFERDLIAVQGVYTEAKAKTELGITDLTEPSIARREHLVPVSIILDVPTDEAPHGTIWKWCLDAIDPNEHGDDKSDAAKGLENSIKKLNTTLLHDRSLHYCLLDQSTDKRTAIQIFVESNKSSVKVNEFDIAVALALDRGDEQLRERIHEFHRQSGVTRGFFQSIRDSEGHIARIGECMLFAGSLSLLEAAPKKQKYEDVIKHLFRGNAGQASAQLDGLLRNIEQALTLLANHGAPTDSTLPALPVLHLLAGLQEPLRLVTGALQQGRANRLISAYIWRAFFTDRYAARANDRLLDDYKGLHNCLKEILANGQFNEDNLPLIFDEDKYEMPNANSLGNLDAPLPWIKKRSMKGRAISAITLAQYPLDLVTNKQLSPDVVRDLEASGKLDRHHVFPKAVLRGHFNDAQMNHALNGVVLSKATNQAFSKKDPKDYISWILRETGAPNDIELRRKVESHFIPYDILTSDERVEVRYRKFIKERARRIAAKVKTSASPT